MIYYFVYKDYKNIKLIKNSRLVYSKRGIHKKYLDKKASSECSSSKKFILEKFNRLLSEWKMQAALLPSATAMAMLPSYQEIIGMGEPALPLILNELKDKPTHLFWALRAISGIDPVPPENRGCIEKMVEAWINWGRQKRIIE